MERDRAICERNELLEKYCHEVKDKAEAQKELDQACKDIETVKEERDVARKERTEAIIQRDHLLREYYQARQVLQVFTDAFFFLDFKGSVIFTRVVKDWAHWVSSPFSLSHPKMPTYKRTCVLQDSDRASCLKEVMLHIKFLFVKLNGK